MNLKYVLMELGNRLVIDYGYNPAIKNIEEPNTVPIKDLVDYINHSPEAQQVLDDMGIEWSVVNNCTKSLAFRHP